MNIENIEAFVYVFHYGSFNKAAEVLFLSQPSVTARIQSLERELDCRLFDRLGKQVQLTEKGRQFLPYAQQLLQIYRKGKQHIQRQRAIPHELRIGCTVSVSNYMIPELLPKLKAQYPGLQIKVTTSVTEDIVNKVLNRELDIGFVRNVSHPNLQSVKYYEDPIRLYTYADHPLAGHTEVPVEWIVDQPFVFFECGSLDWLQIHRVFQSLNKPPAIEIHTDNAETAKKLVLNKAGICFLPGLCARKEVREQLLFPMDVVEVAGIALQTNIITLNEDPSEIVQFLISNRFD
ncbi:MULTISPECIES: LysR family transcriptional regulator [Paenibacillus]|uniref:LysR family transcriptional regulator n=1 Tax=Paenibacillus naphthalenovorans TaxID=162209 RepID=A0A0U2WCC2_9BACL|nr:MULTISPECIES: LysR family transcriptional regulator [Paenibacillus]ALS24030.1 LysR family transcriptional regulator [Paenibacillus naphthalenovorans]GCL72259.1 LysR family transcriptional regulator [Paenibacillus naphthalenovorans]SDI94817.1 DNA-binding transcriptional regulator, LysR family [Paenibacillus naphthalenovorans]